MTTSIIDRRSLAKLALVFSPVAAANSAFAPAFVIAPSNRNSPHRAPDAVAMTMTAARPPRALRAVGGGGEGGRLCDNDRNDDDDGDDSPSSSEALLAELRTARRDMFGADVPSNDDLRAAARNAESDFLSAMREQTESFRRMKDELGSDGACEAFMERIREADDGAVAAAAAADDDDDDDDGRSIVRRMMMQRDDDGTMGRPLDGITAEDDVDSWQ